ncbi:hypothetical protein WDU94_015565 [Cyamophila willieti]
MHLLQFCALEGLRIMGTTFQQKNKYKCTWKHPSSKQWHMIDHIIVRAQRAASILRCRSMRGPQCETDHYLVRATLKLSQPHYCTKKKINYQYNSKELKNDETRADFEEKLRTEGNLDDSNIETIWNSIKTSLINAASKTLRKKQSRRRVWFEESDKAIEELLQRKADAHKLYLANPCTERKLKYNEIKRRCQKEVRTIQDRWWKNKAAELQRTANENDMHNLYRSINEICGPLVKPPEYLIKENGEKVTEIKDRLTTWRDYFRDLYNQNTVVNISAEEIHVNTQAEMTDEVLTRDEIKIALKELKNNKSPGEDRITGEMLKAGEDTTVDLLQILFAKIWEDKKVPDEWKTSTIVPIHKKGPKTKCGNFRGISLLSVPAKAFARLLYNRLYPHIDVMLKDTQCGFRAGRSTVDMVFTTRQIVEKALEQNTSLAIAFIDVSKAFDSVDRDLLFEVLKAANCPPRTLEILKSLHQNTLAVVQIEDQKTDPFEVTTGVKQGCNLAPMLFALYIQAIINNILANNINGVTIRYRSDTDMFNMRGFSTQSKVKTTDIMELMFADDCAVVAKTPNQLQNQLNIFAAEFKRFGLNINVEKTVAMFVNCAPSEIRINNEKVKVVESFKYLGSTIESNGTHDTEVNHRINSASQNFRSLYDRLWKHHNINTKTKLKIYETVILSTLLYASESWTLTEAHQKRLNRFHIRCLKSIMKVHWKEYVPDEVILERAEMLSVDNLIRIRRLKWAGHLSRMDPTRIPHQVAFSELAEGKRPQNKPRLRWKDNIKEDLKKLKIPLNRWRNLAGNRQEWRLKTTEEIRNYQKKTLLTTKEKRQVPTVSIQ